MVYVLIYPQKDYRDENGFSVSSVAKKFRSIKAVMDYCDKCFKPNYIVFEKAADNSFDYYVRLKDRMY